MFISSLYQVYFKFISGCVSRLFSVSRFIHVFLYVYFTIFVRCFSRCFRVDDFEFTFILRFIDAETAPVLDSLADIILV